MHPPTMHPSAPGLLTTPPMAVQIPTAKVSPLMCFYWSFGKVASQSYTEPPIGVFCPSTVSFSELPSGCSTSWLPAPQSEQPKVLPSWKITCISSTSRSCCCSFWLVILFNITAVTLFCFLNSQMIKMQNTKKKLKKSNQYNFLITLKCWIYIIPLKVYGVVVLTCFYWFVLLFCCTHHIKALSVS